MSTKRKRTVTYAVSNKGRIRMPSGRITHGYRTKEGYRTVQIDYVCHMVHRLVAQAFLDQPSPKHNQVNHIDMNRENNDVINLEWATHAEQIQHSHDTNEERGSSVPKRSKPVEARRVGDTEWNLRFESGQDAARRLGLRAGNISHVCNGNRKKHGQFEFRWAECEEKYAFLPDEEWISIEGGAFISQFGRVRRPNGLITDGCEKLSGYRVAVINGNNHYIHRLVAQAFLPPPPSPAHITVNHIDLDNGNNRVDNLEWATHSEQHAHSRENNKNRKPNAARLSKPVRARKVGSDTWDMLFPSVIEASRQLDLKYGNIGNCCRGRTNQTGGYEFEFVKQQETLVGELWEEFVIEK